MILLLIIFCPSKIWGRCETREVRSEWRMNEWGTVRLLVGLVVTVYKGLYSKGVFYIPSLYIKGLVFL